jgi:hypothetical protein
MTARSWTHGKLHPEGPVGNNARGRLRFGNGQHQMQFAAFQRVIFWTLTSARLRAARRLAPEQGTLGNVRSPSPRRGSRTMDFLTR